MDAIADSLVAIVLSYRPERHAEGNIASAAKFTLISAGAAEGPGLPYDGAGDQLLRIIEHAHPHQHLSAIRGLTYLPDLDEAVRALRSVAVSDNQFAAEAVAFLAMTPGLETRGLPVLQELYRRGLVTQERARGYLRGVARSRGWDRD